MSASCTDGVKRTQEQAVADQIDCDLDNMARRCLCQSERASLANRQHWEKIARQVDGIRALVRQRMHEVDRKATA